MIEILDTIKDEIRTMYEINENTTDKRTPSSQETDDNKRSSFVFDMDNIDNYDCIHAEI